jgi:hypothetical protein
LLSFGNSNLLWIKDGVFLQILQSIQRNEWCFCHIFHNPYCPNTIATNQKNWQDQMIILKFFSIVQFIQVPFNNS